MAETPTVITTVKVNIIQSVAILIDGNNIERSLHSMTNDDNCMINFDNLIPKLLRGRGLSRLIYFREGKQISSKLADRLLDHYMGSVVPCHKSADIPLSICATQIARKVDTIIILSGDSDYVELVRHLKGEGVRIEIAAVKATTAQILIDESDHFIEITEEDSFSLTPKRSNSNKRTSSKSNTQRKNSSTAGSNSSTSGNKSTPNNARSGNKSTTNNASSGNKSTTNNASSSNKSTTNNASSGNKSTTNNASSSKSAKSNNTKVTSNKRKSTDNINTKESKASAPKPTKSAKTGTAKRSTKKKSPTEVKSVSDNNKKKAAPKAKSKVTNKPKNQTAAKGTKSKKKKSADVKSIDDFSY